jgi:hypothetical protein
MGKHLRGELPGAFASPFFFHSCLARCERRVQQPKSYIPGVDNIPATRRSSKFRHVVLVSTFLVDSPSSCSLAEGHLVLPLLLCLEPLK